MSSISKSVQPGAATKGKRPLKEQDLTQPVRIIATKSTGIEKISMPSPTVQKSSETVNTHGLATLADKVTVKKQGVLSDEGLGNLVGEYNMYINQSEKRLMLLQYPNRDVGQPYSDRIGLRPLELRIKPKSGVVEVDVPMMVHSNFDKEKGIQYGQAMRNSRISQEGSSYRLTKGFRPGAPGARLRQLNQDEDFTSEEPSHEALLHNFEDANNKGHVMNKLTLGGRIVPWEDGDPIYLLGVFKGTSISLSRLDAMVQLRPLFAHLDALTEQDTSALANKLRGDAGNPPLETEAKAVNMRAKSAEGEDADIYGDMSKTAKILKAMREEPWQRLSWVDSEDERSYRIFSDEMSVQDIAGAPPLVSTITNEQWLDALSCPRIDPIKQGRRVFRTFKSDGESSDTDSSDFDSANEETDSNEDEVRDIDKNAQSRHKKPDHSRSRRNK